MKIPQKRTISINNIALTIYEWGERVEDTPSVIFFHATGFHGRCWDVVIDYLDGLHCYAVDARGHGTSELAEPITWKQYGLDATALAQALNLTGAIAVGHSMGGNSITRAAAAFPDAFSALLLVDPVIMPPERYTIEDYLPLRHFVLKRRREWQSPDEMFNNFRGNGPFAKWQDAALRAYCDHGLKESGDKYTLACRPETEAAIYQQSILNVNVDIFDAVARISIPVRVLRCGGGILGEEVVDMTRSATTPDLASRFANGTDFELVDNTHFIPMESPELIATHIRELLG